MFMPPRMMMSFFRSKKLRYSAPSMRKRSPV
jgi:hypothetical protein